MTRSFRFVCLAVTVGFIAVGVFLFPNAFGRLIESFRDFGLSVAYFFCELFGLDYGITPTVNNLPQIPFFSFMQTSTPTAVLADDWGGFCDGWYAYWRLWADKDNFFSYISFLGNLAYRFCKFMVIFIPFLLLFYLLGKRYLKIQNNRYDRDSLPLKVYKAVACVVFRPVKLWISGYLQYLRDHRAILSLWLVLWLFYFNVFTILTEFFAWYFYFVMSFDFSSIYTQVYKLFLDLWAVFDFIPVWAWVIVGFFVLNDLSRKRAFHRLSHNERRNRGFLNERGVWNVVYGYVGAGKTSLLTDMALSAEVQMLDDAFAVILEVDMCFPYFPWINLENELKRAIKYHVVFDRWSLRRWVMKKYDRWRRSPCREKIFGYDYERYGLTYDNKLEVVDIWKSLHDYACAYFIFTVQSSYIISNYSIRSDKLISDIGNFPSWNTDFFRRDSRLIDSFSRHSHILDFDMLRLGNTMLDENPNRNAFGFGIYVITEIDKERKNSPELMETKRNVDGCNQKNDLFNACLKMSRHACVLRNRVFLYGFCDLQRTGSLNLDMLQLGDVIDVYDKNDMLPVLPFFSPYWVFGLLSSWVVGKFNNFYRQYRYNRGDNTLMLYLLKLAASKFSHYNDRVNNLFGCQTLKLFVERGLSDDGKKKKCKWFRQSKKVYSKRFSTDCLSGIFEVRGRLNTVGIDDLKEYADIMAGNDELLAQHSHFQNELNYIKQR